MTRDEFWEFWIKTFDNKSHEEMRELLQKEEIIEKLQSFIASEETRINRHGTQDPRG